MGLFSDLQMIRSSILTAFQESKEIKEAKSS